MDMQEYMDKMIESKRNQSFQDSPQLTLGELVEKLEAIGLKDSDGDDIYVQFDFGSAIPTTLDSWRGSYSELALGYELVGYDGDDDANYNSMKVEKLLKDLKSAIGKEFYGWKGGDFKMSENTPVWVDNSGNANNCAIVDVLDKGYFCVLLTAYCEY